MSALKSHLQWVSGSSGLNPQANKRKRASLVVSVRYRTPRGDHSGNVTSLNRADSRAPTVDHRATSGLTRSFAAARAFRNASTCKTVQITTFAVCSMPLQMT